MPRIYVTELVDDVSTAHRFRWLVVAGFEIDDAQAACVDYRVMLVPPDMGVRQLREAISTATSASDQQVPNDIPVPAGGLPLSVLRVASPSRLAEKARAQVVKRKARGADVSRVLQQFGEGARPKPGRPPVLALGEKLRVLAAVEDAYETGGTLEQVAHNMAMSRSAVRDLVAWARHDADPPLFTKSAPGRRGGRLTPEARALIERMGDA